MRTLSTRRAQPAVTRPPRAVVVRLHPSAPLHRGWSPCGRAPRLQRGEAGSTPAVSINASVVSKAARTLRTVEAQVRLLPEAPFTNARSSVDEHRSATAVDA